jgi:hypothetical protein
MSEILRLSTQSYTLKLWMSIIYPDASCMCITTNLWKQPPMLFCSLLVLVLAATYIFIINGKMLHKTTQPKCQLISYSVLRARNTAMR